MATDPALSDDIVGALEDVGDHPVPADQAHHNGSKRKSADSPGASHPGQRSKRNRYIAIACNECKRRKIKCNGQSPCQRCGNLNLDCIYAPNCCTNNFKDSPEFKAMSAHIEALQEQVNTLSENIRQLRETLGHDAPNIDPNLYNQSSGRSMVTGQEQPLGSPTLTRERDVGRNSFQGPTSSGYNLGIAKTGLRHLGIPVGDDVQADGQVGLDNGSTTMISRPKAAMYANPNKDPIWSISKDEALRLCNVYEDEIGSMYPFLDMQRVTNSASQLFTFVDALNRVGLMRNGLMGQDAMHGEDIDLIKLVLADALACENGGESDLSRRLFESVCTSPETRLMRKVDLESIKSLTLTAIYHFQIDDEPISWRVVGITARLCMELGLHRAETYDKLFPDVSDRNQALKLFWSIYVLDRRWSFGTGMSFALQDSDIDPQLPEPTSSPYLSQMIKYSHLGSSAWKALATAGRDAPIKKEQLDYLEYQIRKWKENLPPELRFVHPDSDQFQRDPTVNEQGGRGMYRLRVVLYLRVNQMRIIINRPVLHSSASIISNFEQAKEVVGLAQDNIRVLTHINETSDIYRTQQMCFNYFLLSAVGAVFLAVAFAPTHFCSSCREEWDMALALVRGLSDKSHVSKRLWETIRKLKEVGPKLGLPGADCARDDDKISSASDVRRQTNRPESPSATRRSDVATSSAHRQTSSVQDAHSYAAVAMAGLAGHPVDESMFYANAGPQRVEQSIYNQVASPNGIANDLTSLYEAAQGYTSGTAIMPTTSPAFIETIADGNEEEFNRIMSEMF